MKIGYARVSTQEQNLDLQLKALSSCDEVFSDHGISGTQRDRPELQKALYALNEGDVLVVWKLDRLGRSLGHLIELVDLIKERKAGLASISESIDTTTPGGKLFFHVMGALAEFERDLIIERTKAGMKAAKARGQHLGRPRVLDQTQVDHAKELIDSGQSRTSVARLFRVDPATLYRRMKV